MGKFDNVKVGDQLERPHHSGLKGLSHEIAMVTHIWDDPVDRKTYVGLAYIRRDGTVGDPAMKHTKRGLASNKWKPASRDWVAWAQAVKSENVVLLSNPLKSRWSTSRPMVTVEAGYMIQDPDRCEARFDGKTVGEIWRQGSTWHWKLTQIDEAGTSESERAAAKALVSAFEASKEQCSGQEAI